MTYAKKAAIFGHLSTGMGERTLAIKFKRAIEQSGYTTEPIIDIIDWMGENYEPLANLNYDLADGEFSLYEEIKSSLAPPSVDLMLILSWSFSLAALFALGIQKKGPVAAKLFVHHPTERVLTKLYEPADLLITESLLANERGLTYGLDPGKILYLPHVYPDECRAVKRSRSYAEHLAEREGKKIGLNTKIIGCVGRFEYGKNCEFAVEAVRKIVHEGEDAVLILKGDFPANVLYPDYKSRFMEMLNHYRNEGWLLWDRSFTPFPEALEEYGAFDLLLHPSGAEGGSHIVVECLGLGIPVILLECSTNPYLFKGLATFVKTTGEIRPAQLPFYIPDMYALCAALRKEIQPPQRHLVDERFHEKVLKERIPLLFERDPEKIKAHYHHDRKLYAL